MGQDSRPASRLFDYNPEVTERGEGEELVKDVPILFNANSSKITNEKRKEIPMANHFEYYKV